MMAFIKKEKNSSKILGFVNNDDLKSLSRDSRVDTLDILRGIKAEVAILNNLALQDVSIRNIKQ